LEIFKAAYENRGRNFGNGRDPVISTNNSKTAKSRIVQDNLSGVAMLTFSLADVKDNS
jgi:hypothetical protein